MKRENGRAVIDITEDDYEILLWALGVATTTTAPEGCPVNWRLLALANRINEGNPAWVPYEIPATSEANPEGSTP